GGWQKWVAENRPITDTIPTPTETSYTPQINPDLRADLASIEANQPQLIDVRSSVEYAGEASRAQRKGHIPNAINLPRKSLLNADGTLKPIDELKMMFAEAGIQTDAENTVVYCNSGVSASYGLLALRAAGVQKARVYDSSWKEWGHLDNTPIEKSLSPNLEICILTLESCHTNAL
ncbi:MAG: rhodanese-like domain-containing protein, partial [Chloroflexota bacterium]